MASALSSEIRLLGIPFAPVLLASGASTLLTQAYISDYPASGLVLVSPPKAELTDKLFDYEPRFPILVVDHAENLQTQSQAQLGGSGAGGGRLIEASKRGVGRGGKGVEIVELRDGPRWDKTRIVSKYIHSVKSSLYTDTLTMCNANFQEVERWMDRCGY
jgi:hypothetical protein